MMLECRGLARDDVSSACDAVVGTWWTPPDRTLRACPPAAPRRVALVRPPETNRHFPSQNTPLQRSSPRGVVWEGEGTVVTFDRVA
jgi:hypothetical protein